MAANNGIKGEVFNIGGGSRISVNELIERKDREYYREKSKSEICREAEGGCQGYMGGCK